MDEIVFYGIALILATSLEGTISDEIDLDL